MSWDLYCDKLLFYFMKLFSRDLHWICIKIFQLHKKVRRAILLSFV